MFLNINLNNFKVTTETEKVFSLTEINLLFSFQTLIVKNSNLRTKTPCSFLLIFRTSKVGEEMKKSIWRYNLT